MSLVEQELLIILSFSPVFSCIRVVQFSVLWTIVCLFFFVTTALYVLLPFTDPMVFPSISGGINKYLLIFWIRIITKLPNTEQSSKGKVKTQNQSTTGKLGKPQWPWLGTGISKEMVVESDFTAPNLPLPLRLKGSSCHYNSIFNNTGTN